MICSGANGDSSPRELLHARLNRNVRRVHVESVIAMSQAKKVVSPSVKTIVVSLVLIAVGIGCASNRPPETPTPASTLVPTSTLVDGWFVYENDIYGYAFSYPPAAQINTEGVNGFPPEELPPHMTPDDYFAQLRKTYPGDLCVSLRYEMGFVTVRVPWDKGGNYVSPCGVTGVGDYDVITKTETVVIGGRSYSGTGYEVHERDALATFRSEFFITQLEDGTRIDHGGYWTDAGATYEDYLLVKERLLQILASYRSH